MAFYDQRQPGLSLEESEKYVSLKLGLRQVRENYAESHGLDLWQKNIDQEKRRIKAESKRLSAFNSSEVSSQILQKSSSGLPYFLKSAIYQINPNFFPDSNQKIQDTLTSHSMSEYALGRDSQDAELKEKLFKEYTTLTVPTSASESKMIEMRKHAKDVFDKDFAKSQYAPQINEIDRFEAVIEAAVDLRSSNLALYRSRELDLLNESSLKTGSLPVLQFAPDGSSLTGKFRQDGTGNPQIISFDKTSWAVFQSGDENYLVPHVSNIRHIQDEEIVLSFKNGETRVSLASEIAHENGSTSEADREDFTHSTMSYYENEKPHTKIFIDPTLAKEIERRQTREDQENGMKPPQATLGNTRSR